LSGGRASGIHKNPNFWEDVSLKKSRGKGWKILKWVLGIIVVCLLVFFYGVVPWFLTGIATTRRFHYHDALDGKTPASFAMKYQDVDFKSSDGIDLKGWYVPAGGKAIGTIVYVHGFHRSRIEMLPMSVFGHRLGYDGLLFDLRNSGASGGNESSIGYNERRDVEAAVRYALEQEKAPRPVVVWGVSMGAAAALMAAAETRDIDAVISDSSFLNYSHMIRHHYYLARHFIRQRWWWFPPLPAFPIADEVIYWSAWRGHFSPSDFDLEKAVTKIGTRPILFVAVEGDERMPPEIARQLYGDAESELKDIVVVPGKRHGEGFNSGNQPYEAAVTSFLASIQQKESKAPPEAAKKKSSKRSKR
jgi:pimeloyl-ACP methyl ester carboxylesterase